MKYLLIDGNNLGIRNAFANAELKTSCGMPTGSHFGFMQSLISSKMKFIDYQFLIVWDSKSNRRVTESNLAREKGVIPDIYKGNRVKDKEEMPQPLRDFYNQHSYLQKGIEQTGIPQIRINGFEADDVIAAYCKKLKESGHEIVVLTSDFDYLQILDSNVKIYDSMKNKETTVEVMKNEYNLTPKQWVDVGALCGDDGDNIYGVPSVGETTALKEIIKNGSWQKTIENYEILFSDYRKQFPDLNTLTPEEGASKFKELSEAKTEKGNLKYPEITFNMPWTGVAYALENKLIKKGMTKSNIMILMFQERIKLAYSLKKMDDVIEDLPEINPLPVNRERLKEYMEYYEMNSLISDINIF